MHFKCLLFMKNLELGVLSSLSAFCGGFGLAFLLNLWRLGWIYTSFYAGVTTSYKLFDFLEQVHSDSPGHYSLVRLRLMLATGLSFLLELFLVCLVLALVVFVSARFRLCLVGCDLCFLVDHSVDGFMY